MAVPIDVINSLKSLPCFTEIKAISLLANGLSQTSLKVTTTAQVFFAKKLNEETASTEISCALLCARVNSSRTSELGRKKKLSPQVIYHDQQWLVTEFINGITLSDSDVKNDIKISTALTLMAKLHQLPTAVAMQSINQLNTTLSVKRLLTNPAPFIAKHSYFLDKVTKSLSTTITSLIIADKTPSVLCHGDINFTNILLDDKQRPWLIDFECAHVAPVEFDLAMFIAVNNIADSSIAGIVDDYGKLVPRYRPNSKLLNHYILYSFYINGLWYFDNINELPDDNVMYALGIEQWSAFDRFANEHSIIVPKLMSIIDAES
ncbi:MAG: phosphotransferase [Colwellia sp.]|uniref:phosphotransferase n=1 Tax=Colwellia sp. TaxID=56799 RepID=UPI0025BDDBF5|nr:phosphotransferase [Colwellia sp.]NQZ27483.1 phosphotransferase [Colwellia sp.]